MRLRFEWPAGAFPTAMRAIEKPIAKAATAAIREVGAIAKAEGRKSIAAGGFGAKWQNALRDRYYPANRESMSPAVFLFHKVPYADVFEDGATIKGNPLLWLPLSNVPLGRGGRALSVSKFKDQVGQPLHTIKRPGGAPLLAARVRTTEARAKKGVSLSLLRRGANVRVNKAGKVVRGQGTLRSVPLFVGVRAATLRKRFDVKAAIRRAAANLPKIYERLVRGG